MNLPAHVCLRSIDARAGAWRAAPETWLSAAERDEFGHWRNPARRDEWLAGRWLLKQMVLGKPAHAELEVLSRDPHGRGRRPCVLAAGRAVPLHVSLAHAGGSVWAALSTSPHHRVGIDVVPRGSIHDRALELWLTQAEQGWLRHACDPSLAARLWAAKEAVYKATNRGEPFVPARIEIGRDDFGRYTWSRDGVVPHTDDTLLVRHTARSILALAVVHTACANTGVRHD